MSYRPIIAILLLISSAPAVAAPGVGQKVYGARVEKGITEIEARYGRLAGARTDGEDGTVLELSHGFSERFYGGMLMEFEREPPGRRRLEAMGVEGIVALGHIHALDADVAVYAEYEAVRGSSDRVETKLLLQHQRGSFDGRLNLIAERRLRRGEGIEFGYAASADWQLVGELRGGVTAFGDVGTTKSLFKRNAHFLGPILKTEIEHLPSKGELGIELGYLVALGAARDETRGQARLLLEYEFHF
jgi:hypothetical protein